MTESVVQSFGIVSLLPPLLAIVLAIITRNVILSLLLGVVAGYLAMTGSVTGAFAATAEGLWALLQKGWVLKTLVFAVFVGSIIELIRRGGGVDGFVRFLQEKKRMVTTKRQAELLPFFIGLAIFIESSITSLVAGTVSRPLTDRFGVSREKLAYICDSTAAPVCTLFPLNAWGALLLGLVGAQIDAGVLHGEALPLLAHALAFNFYAFFSILLVLYTILRGIDFPAYTPVEPQPEGYTPKEGDLGALVVPIASLLLGVVLFLFVSGGGNPLKGSGSTAVFGAVLTSVAVTALYLLLRGRLKGPETLSATLTGAKAMLPIAAILLFAFSIGEVTVKMGTGPYLAGFAHAFLHPVLLPAGIFLLSAVIAFATGTSWGTFSIMIPIAVTMAAGMGPAAEGLMPLAIAAVISGGVFGDHASPISDTTIIAAMAAGCDLIAHVRTQLPWALRAAALSLLFFLIFSYLVV